MALMAARNHTPRTFDPDKPASELTAFEHAVLQVLAGLCTNPRLLPDPPHKHHACKLVEAAKLIVHAMIDDLQESTDEERS